MRFSWLILGALGLAIFASGLRGPSKAPAATSIVATEPTIPPISLAIGRTIEIARSPDSHFYVDAQVNGARVRMMIDTGASSVALTRADALAAGIGATAGEFTASGLGVGGPVRLKPIRIARLAVGTLAANDVPAVVVEGTLPVSLLGQSYLGRIRSVEIAGDRIVLR